MSRKSSFARAMILLGDSIAAALASLWPRSAASIEARRLIADGHPAGELADVYYLVSFDESAPDAALAAIRAVGFSIREPGPLSGFVTVRARMRLSAYDLTMVGAQLDHTVEEFSGFATLIGAARPTSDPEASEARVERREQVGMSA
jgi:hypothetical protein